MGLWIVIWSAYAAIALFAIVMTYCERRYKGAGKPRHLWLALGGYALCLAWPLFILAVLVDTRLRQPPQDPTRGTPAFP